MSKDNMGAHLSRQAKRAAAIAVIDAFRESDAWAKMDDDTALSASAYLLSVTMALMAERRGCSARDVWGKVKPFLDAAPWDA